MGLSSIIPSRFGRFVSPSACACAALLSAAATLVVGCGDSEPAAVATPEEPDASTADVNAQPDTSPDVAHETSVDVCVDASPDSITAPDAPVDAPADVQSESSEDASDSGPALVWTPCDTSNWADGYPKPPSAVECSTIQVPLDYGQPTGTTIALRVARHKSTAFPTGKAVFQLAGGPGGGAVFQAGIIPIYMPDLRDQFDLVYVDQRGTGGSGYLDCSAGYPESKQDWIACAQEHESDPLNHYRTLNAAHDIDSVRKALGYDKIYLRGGSYGTRLGLEYIRQHGDQLAATVLDGLVPPNYRLFEEVITNFDWGVNRLISDCAQSATCTAVSPTLGDDLTKRRMDLRDHPRPITVGSSPYSEDESLYLLILQYVIADSYWRFDVPHAIHDAATGDNTRWNALMSDLFGAAVTDAKVPDAKPLSTLPFKLRRPITRGVSYVAPALYATVSCAEFLPLTSDINALRTLAEQQTWGNDTSDYSIIGLAEACAQWNVDPIETALLQPVSSNAKVLLLSGAIDMTTTPKWGDEALLTLPNATHIVVPYATHATMSVGCVGEVITHFFEADGNIQSVDTSCVGALTEPSWQ